MTEVAIRDDGAVAVPSDSPLIVWAYQAQQAHRIAQSLAKTSFVPATLRGKPDDITAAILAGDELGLRPMASLRSMDIIQGTPALRAHAMRGLVQSNGHQVQLVESTETRCRMRGRRKGDDEWQTVTWTIERAAKLGLTGKDQWRKQPQTMLMARATGELCRLIASDVLHAMPYAVEELDDGPASDQAGKQEAKPARRTARRAPLETSTPPEPTFDAVMTKPWPGETEPAPPEPDGRVVGADPEAAPEPIRPPQKRMMLALFGKAGITDRDVRLLFISDTVGRDVATSKDLTVAEASAVIDKLLAMVPADEPEPAFEGEPS